MANFKLNKERLPAIISLIIIVITYASERAFKRLGSWNSTSAILQAIAYTIAVLAVFLLLYRCKDYYSGLLAAIFAFKTMPPQLEMLRQTAFDAAAVYYLVRCAAPVMFLFIIYRFYQSQKDEDGHIRLLSIAAILLVTPYISHMSDDYVRYLCMRIDNIYVYPAATVFFYVLGILAIGAIAYYFKGKSAALICDYVIVAQLLRIGRKACSILILAHANMYVGKSYFCWIAIDTVIMVAFAIFKKKLFAPAEVLEVIEE